MWYLKNKEYTAPDVIIHDTTFGLNRERKMVDLVVTSCKSHIFNVIAYIHPPGNNNIGRGWITELVRFKSNLQNGCKRVAKIVFMLNITKCCRHCCWFLCTETFSLYSLILNLDDEFLKLFSSRSFWHSSSNLLVFSAKPQFTPSMSTAG